MSDNRWNKYCTSKKPKKDIYFKLTNRSLSRLVVIARNISDLNKLPSQLEADEIDEIIIKCIHCSKRTAWNYRQALLTVCDCFAG